MHLNPGKPRSFYRIIVVIVLFVQNAQTHFALYLCNVDLFCLFLSSLLYFPSHKENGKEILLT